MRVGFMHDVDGCAGRGSWQRVRKDCAASDSACGSYMWWCGASAGVDAGNYWRGCRVSTIISMSSNSGGVLMRGGLVGKIPPESYAEASTLWLP
jgi:hypothetical protein